MPLVRIVVVLPCLSTYVRVVDRCRSNSGVSLVTGGRRAATVLGSTPQRRPISPSDHWHHSGSLSSVCTARCLSSRDRRQPCAALAPTLCRIASRRPQGRTSALIVCSPAPRPKGETTISKLDAV